MHTVNLLRHLVENYQILVYIFIFLGLIFEGEFILISVGILFHLGALNPYCALIFICLGLFSKTMLGYYIGGIIHKRWNHTRLLQHIETRVVKVMPHFKQNPFWSIFISKFIMGVNNLAIIYSGYHKIDFRKYLKAEFFSTIIWFPALITLGYFFSLTALNVSRDIWRFSFIILLLVILFILIDRFISWAYEVFEEFHNHNNIKKDL